MSYIVLFFKDMIVFVAFVVIVINLCSSGTSCVHLTNKPHHSLLCHFYFSIPLSVRPSLSAGLLAGMGRVPSCMGLRVCVCVWLSLCSGSTENFTRPPNPSLSLSLSLSFFSLSCQRENPHKFPYVELWPNNALKASTFH